MSGAPARTTSWVWRRALLAAVALTAVLAAHSAWADEAPAVSLTPEESAWLAAHPTIRVGPDPTFPPFEFFDDEGAYRGMAADYVALVEQRLGIRIDVQRRATWDAVVDDTKAREIDLLAAIVETPERREYLLFTRPHISLTGIILATDASDERLTLDDLEGKRVVVVAGYVWQEVLATAHPGIELVTAPDLPSALQMTSFGIADAMVGDPASSSFYIRRDKLSNLRVAGQLDHKFELAFAVRKDWPLLRSILEKTVASITPAEHEAIDARWTHLDVGAESDRSIPWGTLLLVGGLALLAIVGFYLWNRQLKRQVATRTAQLSAELEQRRDVQTAVARTTIEITSASNQIAASALSQADAARAFQHSTAQAGGALGRISTSMEAMTTSMDAAAAIVARTAERAEGGKHRLTDLDNVMRGMAEATERSGDRIGGIQAAAGEIRVATAAMTRVVDQTNLLSVNAAIEAVKAGEHGRGFRVVAAEIERLSQQTAETTERIESIVRRIRDAVSKGVREARTAHSQVESGASEVERIGAELSDVMADVASLSERFKEVSDSVSDQAAGTDTIRDYILQVTEGAAAISASSSEFTDVTQQLQRVVEQLRDRTSNRDDGDARE